MKKNITVSPGLLSGSVTAPPSKSAAHRAILCAAMCDGVSEISNVAYSQDILATIAAVKILGAEVTQNGSVLIIKGIGIRRNLCGENIFCNESGSTLRFIIPIALAFGGSFSVSGAGRLMKRPLEDYYRIFDEKNIKYKIEAQQIEFEGNLTGGDYYLSGNVSSQYITGLLFALPLLGVESRIHITTPVESVGYLDMTIAMMKRFGVEIYTQSDYREFVIAGNQQYKSQNIAIEGDYSQAAFYLVANEMGSCVDIEGLDEKTSQGDKAILQIVRQMRERSEKRCIDVSQTPDLVPILSVLAAKAYGITEFVGAGRLRLKESDRLSAVAEELTKLGAEIEEKEDSLIIHGNCSFTGGKTDSHNDHRIAMSLAIAATTASGSVEISGADSVQKSYADFWEKFQMLGGLID